MSSLENSKLRISTCEYSMWPRITRTSSSLKPNSSSSGWGIRRFSQLIASHTRPQAVCPSHRLALIDNMNPPWYPQTVSMPFLQPPATSWPFPALDHTPIYSILYICIVIRPFLKSERELNDLTCIYRYEWVNMTHTHFRMLLYL